MSKLILSKFSYRAILPPANIFHRAHTMHRRVFVTRENRTLTERLNSRLNCKKKTAALNNQWCIACIVLSQCTLDSFSLKEKLVLTLGFEMGNGSDSGPLFILYSTVLLCKQAFITVKCD